MTSIEAMLLLATSALLLVPVKMAVGSNIARKLREDRPADFTLLGAPTWSEVFWPGAVPDTFYWSLLTRRYRHLPSFGSSLARHYRFGTAVSWAHLVLVALFSLLLLWQFVLWPAFADIASQA